jgi:raffinose/stachyose/melibiose transport system permease protein
MIERRSETVVTYLILGVGTVIAVYPFLSILALALSEPGSRPSGFTLPTSFYLGNFVTAWTDGNFSQALVSSLVVAAVVVVCTIVLALPAAYAFSAVSGKVFSVLAIVMLVALVMPYEAMIVPFYQMFKGLNLLNSWTALILPQIGLSLSISVLWLRTAFAGLPRALGEAAEIDGAGRIRTMLSVLTPVIMPAVTTLAILLFLFTWNEFLLALVLIPDNADAQTAPLALSFFAGNRRTNDPAVTAAAAVLVALPILVAYVFLQRKFISGMLGGGIKE